MSKIDRHCWICLKVFRESRHWASYGNMILLCDPLCVSFKYMCTIFPRTVTPHTRCRLKLLKYERIKDFLLMEEEFIRNQERLKPQEEKDEVSFLFLLIR